MFPQPLSYATTSTASSMAVLNTVGVASLVSTTKKDKNNVYIDLNYVRLVPLANTSTLSSYARK